MNMKALFNIFYVTMCILCPGCSDRPSGQVAFTEPNQTKVMPMETEKIELTDQQWKKRLTPEQYNILRKKGTERPFTGQYYLKPDKEAIMSAPAAAILFFPPKTSSIPTAAGPVSPPPPMPTAFRSAAIRATG